MGPDAYLARQPFFREYTRLLVYETGVHFIDTFRFLLGEVTGVYARLRRLNPVIRGEDAGQLLLEFANGATAIGTPTVTTKPRPSLRDIPSAACASTRQVGT